MIKETAKLIFDKKTRNAAIEFGKATAKFATLSDSEISKGLSGKIPKVSGEQVLRELKKAKKK